MASPAQADIEPLASGARSTSKDGSRHVTDEKINTCTHLASAVFAVLAASILLVQAGIAGKPWHIVGFSIYGASLVLMFMASALHHGINASPPIEAFLKLFDYSAVFLLIGGTITPVCLALIRGPVGWCIFGTAWTVAAAGIAARTTFPNMPKFVTNTLYLAMGWLGLFTAWPVYRATSWPGLTVLAVGGIFYSIGAIIYAVEEPNPVPGRFGFHEIWHVFVILGALSHFIFMYLFVLPA